MSEQCPACGSIVNGAVKLEQDSFVLVCPHCSAEYSVPEAAWLEPVFRQKNR